MVEKKVSGLNRACQLIGISKTTYYQAQDPKDRFLAKYSGLKKKVEVIIIKNSKYGIRRIKAELLRKYQITIDKDVLAKLLKLWGFDLKRKINKRKRSWIEKILKILDFRTNLLIKKEISKPLEAITSDMSKLVFKNGTAYLCVHKDVFAQIVYGWSLDLRMETGLILKSLAKAVKNIKRVFKIREFPKELIWHQDQGSQYTSYDYVNQILKYGRLTNPAKIAPPSL